MLRFPCVFWSMSNTVYGHRISLLLISRRPVSKSPFEILRVRFNVGIDYLTKKRTDRIVNEMESPLFYYEKIVANSTAYCA